MNILTGLVTICIYLQSSHSHHSILVSSFLRANEFQNTAALIHLPQSRACGQWPVRQKRRRHNHRRGMGQLLLDPVTIRSAAARTSKGWCSLYSTLFWFSLNIFLRPTHNSRQLNTCKFCAEKGFLAMRMPWKHQLYQFHMTRNPW